LNAGFLFPTFSPNFHFSFFFRNDYGDSKPLRLQLGLFSVSIVSHPAQIVALLKAPARSMSAKQRTIFALRFLGSPPRALAFYQADDSGPEATPRAASATPPEHRIFFLQNATARKYLSGPHLVRMSARFVAILRRNLGAAHDRHLGRRRAARPLRLPARRSFPRRYPRAMRAVPRHAAPVVRARLLALRQ
jgi:hypothetical protein